MKTKIVNISIKTVLTVSALGSLAPMGFSHSEESLLKEFTTKRDRLVVKRTYCGSDSAGSSGGGSSGGGGGGNGGGSKNGSSGGSSKNGSSNSNSGGSGSKSSTNNTSQGTVKSH